MLLLVVVAVVVSAAVINATVTAICTHTKCNTKQPNNKQQPTIDNRQPMSMMMLTSCCLHNKRLGIELPIKTTTTLTTTTTITTTTIYGPGHHEC